MALPFSKNWACQAISKLARDKKSTAKDIARVLSTQPEFEQAIQSKLDECRQPGYDPSAPDNDPAQHVVGNVIAALSVDGPMP